MVRRWRRSEVQLTQPPHSPLVVDTPSGYPEDSGPVMGDVDTPDIADFSVDVTPLASISVSGADANSGPDLSMVAPIAADPGAYTSSIRNSPLYLFTQEALLLQKDCAMHLSV